MYTNKWVTFIAVFLLAFGGFLTVSSIVRYIFGSWTWFGITWMLWGIFAAWMGNQIPLDEPSTTPAMRQEENVAEEGTDSMETRND